MKRVKAACILQTLHFQLKDDVEHDLAVKAVKQEVTNYKQKLQRDRIHHRILEEKEMDDGSVMIKIVKQYNQSPVGDYLNAF